MQSNSKGFRYIDYRVRRLKMKNFWMTLIFCNLFAWGAHGISQVGPKSIGSEQEQFELQLPFSSPQFSQISIEELKVVDGTPPFAGGAKSAYFFLPLTKLTKENLENPEQVHRYFEEKGWMEVLGEDCRISYIQVTTNSIKAVSTWGENKGLVIIGARSKMVQRRILIMVQDIALQQDQCLWP